MVKILNIDNFKDSKFELEKINVSSQGIAYMAKKTMQIPIKITNVKLGAANILKQEMLSIGGDCAVARGIVEGSLPISEVILLGAIDKYEKLINKLNAQPIFGLKQIQTDLKVIINNILNPRKFIELTNSKINLSKLNIMGILNVTPDSFSDGNDFFDQENAVNQAKKMISDGADIIDIGGESTRPGSESISINDEIERTIPIIKAIRKFSNIPISIDTTKSIVAKEAIKAGANIINDISALT
ncbi:MAG: dihydropteroate synthase, partial [Candidatus Cloacimonadota bacterium]|nr:dihydropteroate synthase [Candidatus Cloacimonadota bacterium]